ncbi:MAG: FtsQ-type POTRA domain-containing protein [Bacilli bacterium]|nr:FtsQ-type POTRA domain-containing protein [Bacilli bacterium]
MTKKRKKKFNFKKFIIFIIIILFIYILLRVLLNIKTKNIVILNNNIYSDEDIIEISNIENYPKFMLLNKSRIKNKIKKLDLIDDVNIYKKLGFILEIDIKEKKILYYIRSKDEYMASDYNTYKLDNMIGYPTLINYVPSNIEEAFVNKFKDIDSNVISLISEIEYSKTNFDEKRFLLYMNDGNEVYITISRLDLLNKYIEIIQKVNNKKGILYLDSGNYFEIKK